MLDSCGYLPEQDLALGLATEPSCGDGAFLLPMAERLTASLRAHGRRLMEGANALRAYDLQPQHVEQCQELLTKQLAAEGWDPSEVREVVEHWVRHGDYLLTTQPETRWVIGNPPYIRSEDLDPEVRSEYLRRCSTMTAGSDIFVGFIEAGLRSLAPEGVLSFIVADRWLHNTYGRKLRRLVIDGYAVELLYELHGSDAFAEDVSAYPAIIQIRRGEQGSVKYAKGQPTFGEKAAGRLQDWARNVEPTPLHDRDFRAAVLPDWFDTDGPWPSASPDRLILLEKLEGRCRPLEDAETGTRLGIGIATGADKTFVVHQRMGIEEDRLLPLVTTRHIRAGKVQWEDTWLANPWNDDRTLVDLELYPGLREHLKASETSLRKRHTARKANEDCWFGTIDKIQPGLAERPKLLFQDMKATMQPVLDEGGYYPHHNLYWLVSETWDLHVLGGLLLSKVAEMFVDAYGVKMRGGTLRFQAQYLRLIRVPDPDEIPDKVKQRLAQAFELRDVGKATEAALEAYGLMDLPD